MVSGVQGTPVGVRVENELKILHLKAFLGNGSYYNSVEWLVILRGKLSVFMKGFFSCNNFFQVGE